MGSMRTKTDIAARKDDLAGGRRFSVIVSIFSIDADETEKQPFTAVRCT
jgi:hypothetical protein